MAAGGAKELDQIVKGTIEAVEKSKGQIFDIYEASRREMEHLQRDVERLKQQTAEIIFKVDDIEKRERRSRLRLMEVSSDFHRYSEAHIKEAYEEANRLQVDLAVLRSQEQSLRRMRPLRRRDSVVARAGIRSGALRLRRTEIALRRKSPPASLALRRRPGLRSDGRPGPPRQRTFL